ncbi:hypothetical protein N656DRAFT_543629 [Canariomyces notabilis]|uniref:Uncharacterized protein n=1 Tax=Canariomyces notabilis TaxID=2074819 RepID=A0AAN6THS4_9PEZI|nr:hypothetical protein N656DRAFT_543629 [Canariomyces arenarius]
MMLIYCCKNFINGCEHRKLICSLCMPLSITYVVQYFPFDTCTRPSGGLVAQQNWKPPNLLRACMVLTKMGDWTVDRRKLSLIRLPDSLRRYRGWTGARRIRYGFIIVMKAPDGVDSQSSGRYDGIGSFTGYVGSQSVWSNGEWRARDKMDELARTIQYRRQVVKSNLRLNRRAYHY